MRSLRKTLPAVVALVKLEDVRDALEAAREGTAVLGMGEAGPMTLDLDYSHVLVVAGTGKGRSVLVRSVLAQQLAHGAEVVILADGWGAAHTWADRHPDVTYDRCIEDIHDQLVRLGEELADRMVADHAEVLRARRLVVAIENRGALVESLRRYWEAIRVPGESPTGSPAVAALAALEWASPLLRINLIAASRSTDFLPMATRAAYGLRIASASISDETWSQLTGDLARPTETSSWRPGRFCVIRGMALAPLDGLYLEPLEARHLVAAVIAAGRSEWGVA